MPTTSFSDVFFKKDHHGILKKILSYLPVKDLLNFITMNKAMVKLVKSHNDLKHFAVLGWHFKSIKSPTSLQVQVAFERGHLDLIRELIRDHQTSYLEQIFKDASLGTIDALLYILRHPRSWKMNRILEEMFEMCLDRKKFQLCQIIYRNRGKLSPSVQADFVRNFCLHGDLEQLKFLSDGIGTIIISTC